MFQLNNLDRRNFFKSSFIATTSLYFSGCGSSNNNEILSNNNFITITVKNKKRIITSNSTPKHKIGEFPNPRNPYTIGNEFFKFEMNEIPIIAKKPKNIYEKYHRFGVAINGVVFDPAGPAWDKNNKWHIEVLSFLASKELGIDFNNAHIQPYDRPSGAKEKYGEYHYHGFPEGLFNLLYKENMENNLNKKMFLFGYSADGFPIYAPQAPINANNLNSQIITLNSSYKLKSGKREDIIGQNKKPAGDYDGTFVEDYEYQDGLGNLDEFNGRFGVTPEYPNGTYYYVITKTFPFIPRFFKGEVIDNPLPLTENNMNFIHPRPPTIEQIPQILRDYPSV